MKIVTLSSKDIYGGAAKVAYRLHRSMLGNKINNTFIVNNKRSKDDTVITASSLRDKKSTLYYIINNLLLKKKEKDRIKKWDRYLSTREDKAYMDLEISLLRNTLDNLDFDILQLHWVGESYVNFTEFKNLKQPVVWTLHDCFAFTGICTHFEQCYKFISHCGNCPRLNSNCEKDYSYEVFEQKLIRYKNLNFNIVCPSNWLAKEARKSKLLGDYPISVIPNGIDAEFFYPMPKDVAKLSLKLNPTKKVLLFSGVGINRNLNKGGRLLVEALRKLKEVYAEYFDVELLILGEDSVDSDLGYKTTSLGYVDNEMLMRIAYSAADVTVVPSMYENLPTVIMESMSCGTPVAAFDIGGNSDMVDHQINGYLARPYETDDLAAGIKYCFENNTENTLSDKAREKILDNFKIEDVTQRYIRLYESLVIPK